MEPREHHFSFAKRLIPTLTFQSPDKMFSELTGPKREAFLMFLWQEAAKGLASPLPHADVGTRPGSTTKEVLKLDVIGAIRQGGFEVVVLSMPPALAPNEAIFIALVRGNGGPRVFFFERCLGNDSTLSETDAVLAEVNPESRRNYGFFSDNGLESFKTQLGQVLGISLAGLETSLPPVTMAAFMGAGAGQGPGAQTKPKGLGDTLEKLLLVRAGLPIFFWVMSFVLGGLLGGLAGFISPLLTFVIVVVLLMWLHRIFDARRGRTAYSPGMAVGAWFIPLGNLVLPPLVVRDAWKAVRGPEGSGIVFAWWLFWLAEIAFRMLYAIGFSAAGTPGSRESTLYIGSLSLDLPSSMVELLFTTTSLVSLVVTIGAYGLLWHIVHKINEKA